MIIATLYANLNHACTEFLSTGHSVDVAGLPSFLHDLAMPTSNFKQYFSPATTYSKAIEDP